MGGRISTVAMDQAAIKDAAAKFSAPAAENVATPAADSSPASAYSPYSSFQPTAGLNVFTSPERRLLGVPLDYGMPGLTDSCPRSPVTHVVVRGSPGTPSARKGVPQHGGVGTALTNSLTECASPVVSVARPPYAATMEEPQVHNIVEPTQHGSERHTALTLHPDGSFEFKRWYVAGKPLTGHGMARPVETEEEGGSGQWRIFQWDSTEDVLELNGKFVLSWGDQAGRPLTVSRAIHIPWQWDAQRNGTPKPGATWTEAKSKMAY